ncbi:MAG: hypothetical protein ACFCUO_04455 [Rhodospirillales bacterium]
MAATSGRLAVLWLSIAVATAACGEIRPYVYKRDEFNRDAPDFNKQPVDRETVVICYNNLTTSGLIAFDIASAECARYGKLAQPVRETFGDCPLATPMEAHFACIVAP